MHKKQKLYFYASAITLAILIAFLYFSKSVLFD